MAGSKVPGGSLRAHASNTSKAKSNIFSSKPGLPQIKSNTFIGDGSSSSSSSDTSSDSDGSDIAAEPLSSFRDRVTQTPSKKMTNSAKVKSGGKSTNATKTATPAKSPTVNGLAASVKKEVRDKKIKKELTSSDSESGSDSGSSTDEKANKASAKSKEAQKSKADSDSSSESDSASESESGKESNSKVAAVKSKSPAKKDSTSSSESSSAESEGEGESEGEDDDNSEDATQQIEAQIRNDVTSAQSQSSKAQSTSPKPSKKKKAKPSEPQSEDEDGDVEMMDQSMALTNGGNRTEVGDVPEFIAPDFHLRKLDGGINANDVANFFSKAQLDGKQVWYITAPASLPVTIVQDLTIPMEQAQKGMPVLSHNGDDYRMAFDNPAASSSFRLLIPNKKGDEYSMLDHPINQTMHFTRSETFPPGGPASVTTTQTVSTTKPARPQPEDLRARYTPLGVPSPKPIIPPAVKSKALARVAAQDARASSPSSSKKKRKHRDDGEDESAATASTPAPKDSFSATPSGKKKNPPTEKSAKKQKTSKDDQPRKETPVPVPVPQLNGTRSNSFTSASQPVARSRSSMSPGAALPATQVPTSKQTPVPVPRLGPPKGAGKMTKEDERETKKQEKERNKAEKKAAKAAKAKTGKTPTKVSAIPTPQFDSRGLRTQ